MRNYLVFILLFSFFISCKKNKLKDNYTDYSIPTINNLNQLLLVDSNFFIVGGEKYKKACIYKMNVNTFQISEMELPANGAQKELHGIAKNTLNELFVVGDNGATYFSIDTGKTWQFSQNNTWKDLQNVQYKNNDSCYMAAKTTESEGFLITSDQYGESYYSPYKNFGFAISDIEFTNANTVYLCGFGAVLKSIDTGKNYDFLDAKNDYFKDMKWKNEQEAIVVGYEGSILKTTNAGNSWSTIRNANNLFQKKVRFLSVANKNNAWLIVGEKGTIFYSTDDGNNFKEIISFTKNDLKTVAFINETKAIVAGQNGSLFVVDL